MECKTKPVNRSRIKQYYTKQHKKAVPILLDFYSITSKQQSIQTINNLVPSGDSVGQAACHLAAKSGHIKMLENLWCWAREVQLNLKNDLLLAKNKSVPTAWHLATRCYEQLLEKLWGWAKDMKLNLKDDMMLSENKTGQTAWHVVARNGYTDILEKLGDWAKDV
jgi:ankyrin repeat protein